MGQRNSWGNNIVAIVAESQAWLQGGCIAVVSVRGLSAGRKRSEDCALGELMGRLLACWLGAVCGGPQGADRRRRQRCCSTGFREDTQKAKKARGPSMERRCTAGRPLSVCPALPRLSLRLHLSRSRSPPRQMLRADWCLAAGRGSTISTLAHTQHPHAPTRTHTLSVASPDARIPFAALPPAGFWLASQLLVLVLVLVLVLMVLAAGCCALVFDPHSSTSTSAPLISRALPFATVAVAGPLTLERYHRWQNSNIS